jgi:hypothetical protein
LLIEQVEPTAQEILTSDITGAGGFIDSVRVDGWVRASPHDADSVRRGVRKGISPTHE